MSTTPTPEAFAQRLDRIEAEHAAIRADIARMCAGQEPLHITAARGDIVTFDRGPAPTRLDKAKHAVNVGSDLALQILAMVMLIVGGLLVFAEPFLRAIGR